MNKEEKILYLINKALDGVSTSREEAELRKYLELHPDAGKLYDDLKRVSVMLDGVKEIEPPASLKQRIVNTINVHPAPEAVKESFFERWNFTHLLRYRVAYAFAGGVAAGLLVFGIFIQRIASHESIDVSRMYGTMVGHDYSSKMKLCDQVRLDLADVTGELCTKRTGNVVLVDLSVDAQKGTEMAVTFDNTGLRILCAGQTEGSGNPIKIEEDKIMMNPDGKNRYNIFFIEEKPVVSSVSCILSRSGGILSENALKINN